MPPMIEITTKSKRFMRYFAIWLALAGAASFGLFILEEAYQTVMFSTWQAEDSNAYDILYDGYLLQLKLIKYIERLSILTYPLNPLAAFTYQQYAKSAMIYTNSIQRKILIAKPIYLINHRISFKFELREITHNSSGAPQTRIFGLDVFLPVHCVLGRLYQIDQIYYGPDAHNDSGRALRAVEVNQAI